MNNNNHQIRVVHITTVDISLSHLLLNQLRFLKEAGYQVSAISSPGPEVPLIINNGINHYSVPISRKLFSPLRDLLSLIRLVQILRKERFDIVHVHTPKASFLGQIAAWIAGVPIVVRTLHGFYFHEGTRPLLRRAMIILERFAAQFSDAILSQNSEDIETAVQERICSPEKISYLGNGIDLKWFDPYRIDRKRQKELRKEFKLDPDKPVIGFVGRLVAEKGVPELLQAVKILIENNENIQALLVGPVDYEKSDAITSEIAAEMELEQNCSFVGFQKSMPEIYSLMDVFVLPSHREGFPRSLMEASAMGVPVVATDIRGCREVVQNGENGLLVPLKDPTALAHSIREILTKPGLAKRLGDQGKTIAREHFDEQVVFKRVYSVYQRLFSERK